MNNKAKYKQNIIPAGIILVGTIVSYLIFGPNKIQSQGDQPAQNEKPIAKVRTILLGEEEAMSAKLEKTVIFNSAANSQAVAEYSGKITTVSFDVGDYVKEGQLLAVFDQGDDKNSPKIDLKSSEQSLVLALENLEKTKLLNEENLKIAKNNRKLAEIRLKTSDVKDLDKRSLKNAKDLEDQAEELAKLQVNGAEQQVNQARSAVEQARIAYGKTIIEAPISGLVATKNVNEQEYIYAGTVIGEIVGSGKLEAEVSLNENQINRVQIGDEVSIAIDDEKFKGEILSLSPIANSSNGRFDVKIQTLENYSGQANRSGTVMLELSLEKSSGERFFIPLEAVNIGQTKTIVFVVVDGQAVSKEVALGDVIGTQVEITAGLSMGDEVVVENSRNLQEGQRVQQGN